MAEKEFTQNQIRDILAKASEIQQSKNDLESEERGITSAELQEIASEVGISKEVLIKAIQSVESRAKQEFN
ncbi:hypothetical protein [Gracilimonas sp.]|uniref:hypothetical protein n=1 Tax=Gracilimonas sp. TaxID=1974203 RepID=UPI00287163D3|nr:hypothetical protein [Gracilimonas sp.]